MLVPVMGCITGAQKCSQSQGMLCVDGSGAYAWIASAARAACKYDRGVMIETCCCVVAVSGFGAGICCAAMRGDLRRIVSCVTVIGGVMDAVAG